MKKFTCFRQTFIVPPVTFFDEYLVLYYSEAKCRRNFDRPNSNRDNDLKLKRIKIVSVGLAEAFLHPNLKARELLFTTTGAN